MCTQSKKWGALVGALAAVSCLFGCGGGGGSGEGTTSQAPAVVVSAPLTVDWSQFAAPDASLVGKFQLSEALWSAPVVTDEPVLPMGQPVNLWRAPSEILEVRNRQTGQLYALGVDWSTNAAGQLTFPTGSTVPMVPADFLTTVAPGTPALWQPVTKDGKPLRIATDYQQHQIAVTYRASVTLPDPVQLGSVPVTAAKVRGANPLSVTFYGDSITAGGDTTRTLGIQPDQPGWADLLAAMTGARFRNLSVPGLTSGALLADVEKLNTTASDLVVLAQGMNDATGGITGAQFEANIRAQIKAIRARAPATEFLLVTPWLANMQWAAIDMGLLEQYRAALIRIGGDTAGVAVADVQAMSTSVLRVKAYADVTSNGVNHPNDFMHRVYAQVARAAIR